MAHNLSKTIGEKIKKMRNQQGLSQDEFADKVSSNRTYICKIENGTKNLTIRKLCVICENCGITLKDFFNDELFSKNFNIMEDKNDDVD